MNDHNFAFALLAMAKKDIQALHGMLNNKIFADEIFGFHAQQAVEKCLKAWIAALDVEFPLTHDISLLLATLEDHQQPVSDFWDKLFSVNGVYSLFVIRTLYAPKFIAKECRKHHAKKLLYHSPAVKFI